MLTRLGRMTIGQFLPVTVDAFALTELVLGGPGGLRAALQVDLDAALRVHAAIALTMPSLTVSADGVANLSRRLSAAIVAGGSPPGLSINTDVVGKSIASLTAVIGRLEATLTYAAALTSVLATGTIRAYSWSGVGGIAPAPYAIVAIAQTPEVWNALRNLVVVPNGYAEAGLSVLLPTTVTALASLSSEIPRQIVTISTRLAGLLSASVSLGLQLPSLALRASAVAELSTRLGVMISGGISPPGMGVSLEIAAYVDTIALLELEISGIDVILGMIAQLSIDLGVAGLDVYSYEGPPSDLADLLAGDHSVIALTTDVPATWTSLQKALF